MISEKWAMMRCGLYALACSMALLSCASNPSDEENVQADPPVELPKDVPPLKDYGGIGGAFALRDQRGEIFHLEDLDGRPAMLFFGYTHRPIYVR